MKYRMEQLINRSYDAIKKRGLIADNTTEFDFYDKMTEECNEIDDQLYDVTIDREKYIEEVIDLATVCIMQIHHLGYDFIKEFEKCVQKNEQRAKNGK